MKGCYNLEFLVVSDSHGNFDRFNNVIMSHPNINTIFFLGDGMREFEDIYDLYPQKTFYSVSGNCDLMSMKPSWNTVVTSQGKILYTHGDAFGVKSGLSRLVDAAQKAGARLALFGHTHIPINEEREGIFLFNPGSLGQSYRYGICRLDGNGFFAEHKTL